MATQIDGREMGQSLARSLRGRMEMARRNRLAQAGQLPVDEELAAQELSIAEEVAVPEEAIEKQPEIVFCTACALENSENPESEAVVAEHTCFSCKEPLCENHSYREENGRLNFCYACADKAVGICAECGVLHARSCRECSKKVCDECSKKIIARWGWGGSPGQGGVTNWFPFIHTYCQEHGQNRFDLPRPAKRSFMGYDGSSPEW